MASNNLLEQIKLDISAKLSQAQDEIDRQSAAFLSQQADIKVGIDESRTLLAKEKQEMLADVELARTALSEERAAFDAEKSAVAVARAQLDSKIKLDVGGMHYTTSRTTLCSVPGSMLEAMFSGRFPITLDEDGRAFIDRDGQTFREVLNFLRSPHAFTWPSDQKAASDLNVELEYFGLTAKVPTALTTLLVLPATKWAHQAHGLRVVLRAKRRVVVDGFRTCGGEAARGKRLRVYSKSGQFPDANVESSEVDWTLVRTESLRPDDSSPLKKLCTGLGVRCEPGWHTIYLHCDTDKSTSDKSGNAIAMGALHCSVNSYNEEPLASDTVLEVYSGSNTNSSTPFEQPNRNCFGFVGEILYRPL